MPVVLCEGRKMVVVLSSSMSDYSVHMVRHESANWRHKQSTSERDAAKQRKII